MSDDVLGPDDPAPRRTAAYGLPGVLALTAAALALASLLGLGLLNGSAYVDPSLADPTADGRARAVAGTLVGAALALLPIGLGLLGARRGDDDGVAWAADLARAAVLVAALSRAGRVAAAVLLAVGDGPAFPRF